MPDDIRSWVLIFIFVVLPFLQWIFRKLAEGQAAANEARRRAAGAGSGAGAGTVRRPVEEEPLPEWLDPSEWEEAEEFEEAAAERAPPPRHSLFDEHPRRPDAIPEEEPARPRELATPAASASRQVPEPLPEEEIRRPSLILPSSVLPRPSAARAAIAAPASPNLRARPGILPTAGIEQDGAAQGGFPGGIADLRRAVMWSEVLGKPRALHPHGSDDPGAPLG